MMNKLKNRMGFTLAEVLLVVAILGVLGGVSAVSVTSYQRGMARFECDGIAKEIFVAAQNHLTVAKGQGYLGVKDFGVNETDDIYHFAVNRGIADDDAVNMFHLMLPFGSIDETIRAGGSYIIRYSPEAGAVLDVFYCQGSGRYMNSLSGLNGKEYVDLLTYRGDNNVSRRKQYGSVVLGWYGVSAEIAGIILNKGITQLEAPTIEVHNEEKLYVQVNNPNTESQVMVIVTGLVSRVQRTFSKEEDFDDQFNNVLVLDDVTKNDRHFSYRFADAGFFPGENITIQAVAYMNPTEENYQAPSYSAPVTTNSLFADGTTADTARIANIRHLENLDKAVSNLNVNNVNITKAEQIVDMSWTQFQKNIQKLNTGNEDGYRAVSVAERVEGEGRYYPINPDYALSYDGQSHSISDVKANADNAGLFGSIGSAEYETTISNLELIDFTVTGTTSAGALAGKLTNCAVANVLARNSTDAADININAPETGGLVGILNGGSMTKSAAAMIVRGSTCAGGLIGTSSGTVTGCYSGGHTKDGSYVKWLDEHTHDVTGGIAAGGLIGYQDGGSVRYSYSTCSVSGSGGLGSAAGGFVGSALSSSIFSCYCTGKVDGTADKKAFIGKEIGTENVFSGNRYFSGVNVEYDDDKKDYDLMVPGGSGITAFDLNATTYNDFVGAFDTWDNARAYDKKLVNYYSGKYNLPTVNRLYNHLTSSITVGNTDFTATHYGDWPSPEVFFVNVNT